MEGGASAFDKAPIDCFSMWTVHSYDGDYNPLHDHDVSYDQKCMAFSIILYCMVPDQIAKLGDNTKLHSNGVLQMVVHILLGVIILVQII